MGCGMSHVRRRQLLGWLGRGATLALVAACSAPSPPDNPPPATVFRPPTLAPTNPPAAAPTTPPAATIQPAATSAPAAVAVQQPKSGGILRIGRVGDVTNLEPMRNNPAGFATNFTLYDRLTEYDAQMQPQPRLAESWEFGGDGKTITVHSDTALEPNYSWPTRGSADRAAPPTPSGHRQRRRGPLARGVGWPGAECLGTLALAQRRWRAHDTHT
jgi:hypothetical protein